jgi:NodT family efflux transporter outer membrane factor (OMF) lipoprotein
VRRARSLVGPALAAVLAALASGCVVGPNYTRPPVVAPDAYKENAGWKVAEPRDDALRGSWWELFGDPQLNALAQQVSVANQNLLVAEATYRQARALVRQARAAYFPTVTAGVGYTRSRQSDTLGSPAGKSVGGPIVPNKPVSTFQLPIEVAWTPDFWGRVRRAAESGRASAQASAGDLETARLSFQAELAQDYFQLRMLDAQKQLLDDTVTAFTTALQLTRNRYASGVASRVDIVQAETQLKTTQAQAIDVGVARAQTEHAIALLIGQPASTFSIPPAPLAIMPPPIPVGVPSALLERRPDIAAAERRMAAANAQIGVAVAAYYPTVTLSFAGGLESGSVSQWFTWPSRFWSVGPSITETVYDGGLRKAQTDQARAAYDGSVAAYRQAVLAAFQGVEDNLAALRILEEEARVQTEAVRAAQESVGLTTNQYKAGIVSYLNVITVQTIALTDEITAVQIHGRRMAAAVLLIQALGGGWISDELPSPNAASAP